MIIILILITITCKDTLDAIMDVQRDINKKYLKLNEKLDRLDVTEFEGLKEILNQAYRNQELLDGVIHKVENVNDEVSITHEQINNMSEKQNKLYEAINLIIFANTVNDQFRKKNPKHAEQ